MDDQRMERLEGKVDKLLAHVANIDITIAKQEVHLAEHMERTRQNEKAIKWLYGTLFLMALGACGTLLMFILEHQK